MTAIANSATPSAPVSFEVLLAKMQPYFRKYAKRFSPNKRLNRDDVMQDLTGIALEMYTSLVRRGKEVFYSPLAIYAITAMTGMDSLGTRCNPCVQRGGLVVSLFSLKHMPHFGNTIDSEIACC